MSEVEGGNATAFPPPPPVVQLYRAVAGINDVLARIIASPSADSLTMLGAETTAAVATIARTVAPLFVRVEQLGDELAAIRAEVMAMQKELGLHPSDRFVDVAERLANIELRLDGEA